MDNKIEVSVVLPCLNEEKGIGICINKIKEVFLKENIKGEIIVADNGSTDRSREISENNSVKVVLEPRPGYGAAYLCGLGQARGKYIVIADSDNTYDFFEIPKFLKPLKEGYDFVIGSRFKGKIKKRSMPWAHRYIGNPVISGIFRLFFHTRISDALCGMRAFTYEAYHNMKLMTLGMEFATEMIVSALQNNLKLCEVPIDYYPREGKSKLRSFLDGWRYMRFMLLYCPIWLYFIPGIIGFFFGISILLFLLQGPFLLLGRYWDIHVMVLGSVISILSFQVLNMGIYAHVFAINQRFLKEDRFTSFIIGHFSLEKGLLFGASLFLIGLAINLFIFIEWFSKHFGALYRIRESILAMTLLIIGLQTIFSSFFVSLLFLKRK
jgi:glycosyltransferase involved in cell wall biosynthesis